ncbi:glycosyltransferase [Dokdonia sp. Dokd-P16]|uniref:glycosyltransferase family 2 protein n=1 Tax=Dokdonia sp. Dokd-P16 TaxID=2173169 RepID=UPI000D544108|nr:glycosyltransferase family 2 protein [Dokdonia sp. Dokd-P16]AWH72882.1 glycosyltransferase [Dokdonia sp. Dokd-P16]
MKLSIITINYNDVIGLERTIKSVLEQTASDYEYIIIDGNSTDGSKEIIAKYTHHFSYNSSEPDHGVYDAMNKGIKNATGDYLLFLNSGDTLFNPEVIEKVLPHLRSEHDLIYGDLYMVPTNQPSFKHTYPKSLDFTFFKQTSLGHPATFIKKELFEKHGNYRTDLHIVSDWAFFLKVICVGQATYKKIDLVVSNFYEGGISTTANNKAKHKAEIKKVLLEHYGLYNSSFDALLLTSQENDRIFGQVNPQLQLVTTNQYLLKILNKIIAFMAWILKKKRS